MDQFHTLLNLPFQTLALLAAGYMSYRLAYTGKDAAHGTIDVVFLVIVFAFVAKLVSVTGLWWLAPVCDNPVPDGSPETACRLPMQADIALAVAGIVAALAAASCWRRWGEKWAFHALRALGVSNADRHDTAWQTVMSKPGVNGTVLVIRKKDGSEVMSEGLSRFNGLPFGACVLGRDGSVALYVTHRRGVDAEEWSERDPSPHEDWGAPVTVIPASEIAEIEFRAA